MASLGNILLEKEILLESGTNEVEILVFRVGGYSLGINVAKVREVLPAQKITHLPQAHSSITGCFTLRDHVIPCVSLHRHLCEESLNTSDETTIILTEFNQHQTAFVVDAVERIHRVNWQQVLAAPNIVTITGTPVTAVTDLDGRLISMLDFEMIADQVSDQVHRTGAVANPHDLPRHQVRILLADDSATVRQAVAETLHESGYTTLKSFENGEEAWNWILQRFEETGDVDQVADLLISDVEMPRVDGLRLTKNVKGHPGLSKLCVLLYSSILTEDNRKKGMAVKADAMITKPELTKVVGLADELIVKRQSGRRDDNPAQDASLSSSDPTVLDAATELTEHTDEIEKEEGTVARGEPSAPPDNEVSSPATSEKEQTTPVENVSTQDETTATDKQVDSQKEQTALVENISTQDETTATDKPAASQKEQTALVENVSTQDETTATDKPAITAVNSRLGLTFRNELSERVNQLRDLFQRNPGERPSDEAVNETFRVLHSIKSAAMVVPVDEVTHVTHVVEELMDAVRHKTGLWPQTQLDLYVNWLFELTNPTYDEHEVQTILTAPPTIAKAIPPATNP